MIELRNVTKIYKTGKEEVVALKNVNLTLPERGLVFIVGKSGSGKTTLLNILGGLDTPSFGGVYCDGAPMPQASRWIRDIGYVFQGIYLFPFLTAEENVRLAQGYAGRHSAPAREYLHAVELDGTERRKARYLSGGEQQRVAIARMLAKDARLVIADEPTGSLDEESAGTVFRILKEIAAEKPVLVVTHDEESAEAYADRLLRIADGELVSDEERSVPPAAEEKLLPVGGAARRAAPPLQNLRFAAAQIGRNKFKNVLYTIGLTLLTAVLFLSATVYGVTTPRLTWDAVQERGVEWIEIMQTYYRGEYPEDRYRLDRESWLYLEEHVEGFYPQVWIALSEDSIDTDSGICDSFAALGLSYAAGGPDGEVIVLDTYAEQRGIAVGDTIVVYEYTPDDMESVTGVVGGIVDSSCLTESQLRAFPNTMTTKEHAAKFSWTFGIYIHPTRAVIFTDSLTLEELTYLLDVRLCKVTRLEVGQYLQGDLAYTIASGCNNFAGARSVLLIVGAAFVAALAGYTFLFVSLTVSDNKREIGVLRALGARTRDVCKIFLVQYALLFAIALALCVPLLWGAFAYLGGLLDVLGSGFVFFKVNLLYIPVAAGMLAMEGLAVLLPMLRVRRLPLNTLMRSL